MPYVVSLHLFSYVSPHAPSPAQAPTTLGTEQYVSLIGAGAAGAAGAAFSNTSSYKISLKSDNRSMNYGQISDFQDGGRCIPNMTVFWPSIYTTW